jgi:hypothetical protein
MVQKRVDFTGTPGAEKVEIFREGLDTNPSQGRGTIQRWMGGLFPTWPDDKSSHFMLNAISQATDIDVDTSSPSTQSLSSYRRR